MIILEIRVEQGFRKLVLALVTLAVLRISTVQAALIILDVILLARQGMY